MFVIDTKILEKIPDQESSIFGELGGRLTCKVRQCST